MSMRFAVLTAWFFALLLAFGPATASAWQTLVPATPAASRPLAITTRGTDVIAVGRVQGADDEDGIAVALSGADGTILWERRVAGDDAGDDTLESLALDAGGNVVVAGQSDNHVTGLDALVLKLAADTGVPLWRRDLDGGGLTSDDALDVKVLANGDVLVAGRVSPDTPRGPFAVWRLAAASGATLWEANVDGDGGVARRLAVSSGGAILVAGHLSTLAGGRAIVVAEIDPVDGAVLWQHEVTGALAGAGSDTVDAIALRAETEVVVAGTLEEQIGDEDFAVVALDRSDGSEAWRQVLTGSATGSDRARRVAVAPGGDVFAAGDVANAVSRDDWLLVRLAGATGALAWRSETDGRNEANDSARGLALGGDGHPLVTGRLRNPGVSGDVAAMKFDAATGDVLWLREADGAEESNDIAFDVAADVNDDVAVAARTQNGDGADEFTILKLSGVSGASFPCGDGDLDDGEACDDGNNDVGDGCRPNCTVEVCGDGIVDPQDACDDGGTEQCCSESCEILPDATDCNDADACTLNDTCLGGACVGADVACVPASDCEASTCDPDTGTCVVTPFDGDLCDDGDACTLVDRCRDGVCVSGPDAFCDDGDACTVDSCDPADGCVFTRLEGFDGVLCTFDPSRTAACLAGVPRTLRKRLDRAERRMTKASESTKPGRTRRLVKRSVTQLRKGHKKATRLAERARVTPACGAALVGAFTESLAPAEALLASLQTSLRAQP
jgi:cysteine-rich repeat protein